MSDLLLGLAGFGCFALLHMLLLRRGDALNRVANIFLLGMGVHVLATVAGALLPGPHNYWAAAGVYWFLLMFWVYAYGTAAKSLTVRMLVRVAREAPAAESTLTTPGGADDFGARMQSLQGMGYAEETEGIWALTAKGRAVAGRLRAVQGALKMSGSSLYDWG